MQAMKTRKYALAATLIAAAWTAVVSAAEPTDLLQGAGWQYSADGGKTFSDTAVTILPGQSVHAVARATFVVDPLSPWAALELTHGLDRTPGMRVEINGVEVRAPMEGMRHHTIPAIDPAVLRQGANALTVGVKIVVKAPATQPAGGAATRPAQEAKPLAFAPKMTLRALRAEDLRIQTGPILGAVFEDSFTVTCRTNMPATVFVAVGRELMPMLATSPNRLIHRLRVRRREGLVLWAERDCYFVQAPLQTPAWHPKKLRFVATGDSRTNPQDWAKVAAAVADVHPDLLVFSGDMVKDGRDDWRWDDEFAAPAAKLLASVPFYAVIGNHEKDAVLYDQLFYTPSADGLARNWVQQIGGVLLIGVDGTQDWSAGGRNAAWLEEQLRGAKADFIFVADHYAAWTSAKHGLPGADGKPAEREVRQAQEVIWPLLVKYRATAMIAGHDHVYERSEPPGGVPIIISGGGGAPRYEKVPDAEKQNPYSKVFCPVLNYCLFEIADGRCTMRAYTPAGELLDTRVWTARAREVSSMPASTADSPTR